MIIDLSGLVVDVFSGVLFHFSGKSVYQDSGPASQTTTPESCKQQLSDSPRLNPGKIPPPHF